MSHLSSDIASARFLREGEEEKLLEFLISAFDRWPSHEIAVPAIDHLRWKLRSHQKDIGRHIVAELGSEIVGSRLSLVSEAESTFARACVDFEDRAPEDGAFIAIYCGRYPPPPSLQ